MGARRVISLAAIAISLGAVSLGSLVVAAPMRAAIFLLTNEDAPGAGLNDPTPVEPTAGNPGTTVGQQRLEVLQAALDTWGTVIDSAVPIRVAARFDALECDENAGVLGAAAPFDFLRDFPDAPRAETWYPYALADSLAGIDLVPGEPDIVARFNQAVDEDPECFTGFTWWYGLQGPAPPDTLPLFDVVLHEIAHGLGFTTLVDPRTGERALGFDDAYMLHLEDHSLRLSWPEMTDEERAISAVDTGDLHWVGPGAVERASVLLAGVHPGGHLLMYAPDPLAVGSSIAHWDPELLPDELMEPFLNLGAQSLVTPGVLEDLGYRLLEGVDGTCVPDPTTLCIDQAPGDKRFQVQVEFRTLQGGGGSGLGRAIPLSSLGVTSGGLFWFFSPDNPEMLVKVLDGCSVNGHYWVFYSAGTNVGLRTEVTDTHTGRVVVETNPDLLPAPPVQNVRAFPCEEEDDAG